MNAWIKSLLSPVVIDSRSCELAQQLTYNWLTNLCQSANDTINVYNLSRFPSVRLCRFPVQCSLETFMTGHLKFVPSELPVPRPTLLAAAARLTDKICARFRDVVRVAAAAGVKQVD
jgi:hypothetical protein